ncbi:MAG: CHC2 zinc finger domain-containing protein, partial [Thermodesulfobacteriota bacterium]
SNKALCPFHDEKTPSFHNFIDRGFCFGCGRSADAIDLEYELGKHNSKYEAVLALNDRYHLGLKFNGFDKERAEEIGNAQKLLEWYCEQAHKALLENQEDLVWLEEKKGITVEDVKKYCIGYVGQGGLKDKLAEKSKPLCLKIGLLKKKAGKSYNTFRNRFIFPIWQRGKIVSIWARKFPEDGNNQYKWLGLSNSEFIPHKLTVWAENLTAMNVLSLKVSPTL